MGRGERIRPLLPEVLQLRALIMQTPGFLLLPLSHPPAAAGRHFHPGLSQRDTRMFPEQPWEWGCPQPAPLPPFIPPPSPHLDGRSGS